MNVMLHFIASSSARVGVRRKDAGAEKSKPGKTEGDTEKGVTCMYMCMCVSVCVKWLMIFIAGGEITGGSRVLSACVKEEALELSQVN